MGMAEENEEHSCCAGSNTAATISDHMICLVGADRMEAGANLLGGEEFHRRSIQQLIRRDNKLVRNVDGSTVITKLSIIKSVVLNGA